MTVKHLLPVFFFLTAGLQPVFAQAGDQASSDPQADFIDVALLSPEEGKVIPRNDFMFAAALFYDEDDAGDALFLIELNGRDITSDADISPFLIKYTPDTQLFRGEQIIRISVIKEGVKYLAAEYSFIAAGNVSPAQTGVSDRFTGSTERGKIPQGTLELSARNQEVGGYSNDALDARLNFSGQLGDLRYDMTGFLTSLESSRLQAQNRYSGRIQYNDWLRLEVGDMYPIISELSANGRKVRGISADLRLFNEKLQFQFLHGEMKRGISNLYQPIQYTEQYSAGEVVDTLYTIGFRNGGRGAFRQNITSGKVAIGSRQNFQFSMFGMQARDDTTSLNRINGYTDVVNLNADLTGQLRPSDLQTLEENPERLQMTGSPATPKDNMVLGSELFMAFDSQRISLQTEAAVSLFNRNVYGGPLTQQRADELGVELDENIENLFSRLSWLIIVNENMNILPFRYEEQADGNSEITPFFPAAVLANKSGLRLNYAGHDFRINYRWIGPEFQSLANRTLLRDVAGFTITDRFRLFRNRLFVTLGYEHLKNNVLDIQDATLNTETARASVSWFPIREFLPDVMISFRHRTRNNNVERFNPYVSAEFLESAVRNFRLENGEPVLTASPRNNRTLTISSSVSQNFNLFGVNHQANVSYSYVETADELSSYGDSENNTYSLLLMTRFESLPVRTRIGWNSSRVKSVSGLSEIDIDAVNAGGDLFLLNNNLIVNADLSVAANEYMNIPLLVDDNNSDSYFDNRFVPAPAHDQEKRSTTAYTVRMGAEWQFYTQHTLAAYLHYTNLQNQLAAERFPDDRIMQMRYIYRF